MDIVERLRKGLHADPERSEWQTTLAVRELIGDLREPVSVTKDLRRIADLPRRPPPDLAGPDGEALVQVALARWGLGPVKCVCQVPAEQGGLGRDYCIERPTPLQAWALHEMSLVGGSLAPIVVGGGKTVLDILAAVAVPNVRLAVLFVPPKLRAQLRREYHAVEQHFRVPQMIFGPGQHALYAGRPIVHVVPYSLFNRPDATAMLEKLSPDLVIADEGHKLRHRQTATVGRVLRYWIRHKGTRLCTWSGTLLGDSIRDVAHLSALALKNGSPFPLDPAVVEEWALAVDPIPVPSPAGALGDYFGLPVRQGLNRRIIETPGVVSSPGSPISTPLRILERKPPAIPDAVANALVELRQRKRRPDGQDLVEDAEVAACASQLACGFFYRWRFPNGEPEDLILQWFDVRAAWAAEVREKLTARREGTDSESLVRDAARRFHGDLPRAKDLPEWNSYWWPRWRDIKDSVRPVEGDPVWVDDWLARDAAEWASSRRAVVWYGQNAFGERVASLLGLPLHGGGIGSDRRLLAERGDRSIVVSMKAHGTGTDGLQRLFWEQLLTSAVASGQTIEQVLGRLHRVGQRAAEVVTWRYLHTAEVRKAWAKAADKALFIGELLHGSQKLTEADLRNALDGTTLSVGGTISVSSADEGDDDE